MKSFTFGCSYGWNEGVHKVSIQTKNTTYYLDGFGITTNIEQFRANKRWYGNSSSKGYFYTMNASTLVTMNDIVNERYNNDPDGWRRDKRSPRKENDKISICFDANNWKVTCLINDKEIGTFRVMKYETYYFFVSSGGYLNEGDKRSEYHLIIDY